MEKHFKSLLGYNLVYWLVRYFFTLYGRRAVSFNKIINKYILNYVVEYLVVCVESRGVSEFPSLKIDEENVDSCVSFDVKFLSTSANVSIVLSAGDDSEYVLTYQSEGVSYIQYLPISLRV